MISATWNGAVDKSEAERRVEDIPRTMKLDRDASRALSSILWEQIQRKVEHLDVLPSLPE